MNTLSNRFFRLFFSLVVSFFALFYINAATSKGEQLVEQSKKYLGAGYQSGALGPKKFDCSGFVYVMAQNVGMQLPRTSQAMYNFAKKISDSERKKGDLVFFKTVGTSKISHVGIYIGENKFIHCASDGPETGVIISSLDKGYWQKNYAGAGKIFK